jgi:hypothetical protein
MKKHKCLCFYQKWSVHLSKNSPTPRRKQSRRTHFKDWRWGNVLSVHLRKQLNYLLSGAKSKKLWENTFIVPFLPPRNTHLAAELDSQGLHFRIMAQPSLKYGNLREAIKKLPELFDLDGLLHHEFVPPGQTGHFYVQVLQRKRRDKWQAGTVVSASR